MGESRQWPPLDQSGLTLIEALLAVIIVSVAVITIAGGLWVSARVDNATNERQRANLALTTFTENLTYVAPGGGPCGIGAGAPVSSTGVSNPSSHAANLMQRAVEADEVREWVDRGMMFRINSVEYASTASGPGQEVFGSTCPTPPSGDGPVYPVIKVEVEACRMRNVTATACSGDIQVVTSDIVRRGGRTGA